MEKYTRVKLLGSGSYGTATLFTTKDGKKVVIKEIDIRTMPPQECKAAEQEAKVLLMLNHSNIVSCVESFRHQGKLCIVMDFCSEGDLQTALTKRANVPIPEETVLDWFVQICLGLKHVHDRQILHRDLKPQNVFMSTGGLLKLGDFGVSKVLASGVALARTAIGTPYYISPEICQNRSYNAKSDMWSLGCILYEMATLQHPFLGRNLRELYGKICVGTFVPIKPPYSQELRNLVASMLRIDPAKRPTVNEVLGTPLLQKRIHKYLSETGRVREGVPSAPIAPLAGAQSKPAAPLASRPTPPAIVKSTSASGAKPAAAAAAAVAAVHGAPNRAAAAAPAGRPSAGAPAAQVQDIVQKRQLAAQDAQRKMDELRVQEQKRRDAVGERRVVEAKQAEARAQAEAEKREEARKAFEAAEAKKRAKVQAEQDALKKEADRKDADKRAADKVAQALTKEGIMQDKRQQVRDLMRQHRAEWTMHRQESGVDAGVPEPQVFAPSRPPPGPQKASPASASPPKQAPGRARSPDLYPAVPSSRELGRPVSFSQGDGFSSEQRRKAFEDMKAAAERNRRVCFQGDDPNMRRTRSAPSSPRSANGAAFPRPQAQSPSRGPSPTPSRGPSRPASPKAAADKPHTAASFGDDRARAYRDMQEAALRNKSRVQEQNDRVLDIMGRPSPAKGGKAAPAGSVHSVQAWPAGGNPPQAVARAGQPPSRGGHGPSLEQRRAAFDDMRAAAERNKLQVMGNGAIPMPSPFDLEDGRGIGRSDSVTSDDHRDYGELLHNLQSVCADDPAFREALAADAAPKQEEPVMQAPKDDGQSKAIKQRAADLRRMLQQRLGPVIFERVLQQVEDSDPGAKDDRKVDELLRILGPGHIKDLRLVFELMTYEELAQATHA